MLFQNIRFIDVLLSVNLIEQVYVNLKTENFKDVLEYLLTPKKNNKAKLKYDMECLLLLSFCLGLALFFIFCIDDLLMMTSFIFS